MVFKFNWRHPTVAAFWFNAPLILFGVSFTSFDAYTHIFFADHYRLRWFDLFEPRWFGGFSVASYPPLVHQVIALLSFPAQIAAAAMGGTGYEVRFRAEAIGYSVLLWAVLCSLPVAVQKLAEIFVPRRAAATAAWMAVGLPSIYVTAYSFGQLPTLAASVALLWAIHFGWKFSVEGRPYQLLLTILWAMVTASAHHAVLLFAIILGATLLARLALNGAPIAALARFVVAAVLAMGFAALAVFPFIQWSIDYVPQAPIDHLSRHNLLTNWQAAYFFLFPMYGWAILIVPLGLYRLFIKRKSAHYAPLLVSATLLLLLGLGGTTPLPQWIFGSNWQWLTYDRFSLWAGLVLLLPGAVMWHSIRRRATRLALAASAVVFCAFAAFASTLAQAQPPAVALAPIAQFLNHPARQQDRYLTFGFGDQLARLSVLTRAATLDGTYFTAREIGQLRYSGYGTFDGAIWNPKGASGLLPYLRLADGWGVRWAFSAHPAYIPLLMRAGWQLESVIAPGVLVWRNGNASTEPISIQHEPDAFANAWWGIVPPLALAAALALTRLLPCPLNPRLFLLSLVFVLFPFWYFVTLWTRPHPPVYFTYTSGLLFLADVLAIALIMLTPGARPKQKPNCAPPGDEPPLFFSTRNTFLLTVIFALFSAVSSADTMLSVAFGAHMLAMAAVVWAVRHIAGRGQWAHLSLALAIGAMAQSAIALAQAATQSTAWLEPLALWWPGALEASTAGASVVGLADGARWLRAYGTLPHPNFLAGYLLVALTGSFIGYMGTGRRGWLVPFVMGISALALAFSRAGWLATGGMLVAAFVLSPRPMRGRVAVLIGVAVAVSVVMAIALSPLFVSRLSADARSPQEAFSISDRRVLAETAATMAWRNPLDGVGAGAFVPAMLEEYSLTPEPVHNVWLLAFAETGVGGGLATLVLTQAILRRIWRGRGRSVAGGVMSAAVIGMLIMSAFDHFAWSLSQGRLLMALLLGLWLGALDER